MYKSCKFLSKAVLVFGFGALVAASTALAQEYTLESAKIKGAINFSMDEKAWDEVKALNLALTELPYMPKNTEGMGITKTDVVLKSLYDDENLYIFMQYDDPTKSVQMYPWEKQADGSWKQKGTKDEYGVENVYYEDKASIFWNINTRGFEKRGCAIACHITKDGMNGGKPDGAVGRKYTRGEGETIDMWHWKAVRTGLAFDLTHDQYVDSTSDPKLNSNWGRKSDETLSGGYKNNVAKDSKVPAFMSKNQSNDLSFILDDEKVEFTDTFAPGNTIPYIIVSKMEGSGADVATINRYEDGKWTLIFKRALLTKHPKSAVQDVQFDDLSKPYYFGVSVFDHTSINHIYHDGSIKLVFK